LFGSGISVPAGMPKLDEITERVLAAKGIYYRNETFFSKLRPSKDPAKKLEKEQQEDVQRIVTFLHRLKGEIDYYYEKQNFRREANYEDLCYVSGQIPDCIFGDFANPVVQSFIDKILPYVQPLLVENVFRKEWRLVELADKATEYIKFVISLLLSAEPTCLDYLGCIEDACQDTRLSSVDIFTLNHDTVFRKIL
jgi:hypothetical protein